MIERVVAGLGVTVVFLVVGLGGGECEPVGLFSLGDRCVTVLPAD